ncbi:MAG: hypothetical protein JHC52_03320 [Chthoniobacterales bacterium]|nr:hypothetical protein [Chthoniobacterales bacterium]
MSANQSTSRIVAVQGTAQLTSAIAALRAADQAAGSDPANHLVIHDLCCPDDQAQEFADCIGRLAQLGAVWQSIHYVSAEALGRLSTGTLADGWSAAATGLRECIGVGTTDELFLGQNLLFINQLLYRAYPDAVRACYGDGIGLNFSNDYYRVPAAPRERWGVNQPSMSIRSVGSRLKRNILHRIRRWVGLPQGPLQPATDACRAQPVPFDRHYLLLANLFDEQRDDFIQLDAADFHNLFAAYGAEIEPAASQGCSPLVDALPRASSVVVLLTSNFSETGRMTLDGEIACCMESVLQVGGGPGSLLVIKPHPRDARKKIDRLTTEARRHFAEVVSLDDRWTFYLPFESVFVRFFPPGSAIRAVTQVVCTSSAALSLEHLYGQQCSMGFGAPAVRQRFATAWQSLRLRHEADLVAAIRLIRERAVSNRPAPRNLQW